VDINTLFDEVYPPLFRYCHRLTGDRDQADDLAQEAFVRLLDRGPRGPAHGLRVWMFRVATNLIRDAARQSHTRRRIMTGAAPPDPVPSPEGEMERSEKVQEVRAALSQLPPRDREVLLLRQEGLSYKEIAQVVNVAPTSVGTLLARALRRFESVYAKEGQGNGTSG
jgi:RNA polymerase sigma-70 factor (ECF subfamily)